MIASVGANYQEVLDGEQCLTGIQVNALFNYSLTLATQGAQAAVSSYSSLCRCVQYSIVDMVYSLGQVREWHDLLATYLLAEHV